MNSITEGKEYPKKDFSELAEIILNQFVHYTCQHGHLDYTSTVINVEDAKQAMVEYGKIQKSEGYSERSKEVRELVLNLRQYRDLIERIGLEDFKNDHQFRLYNDLTRYFDKALASFTELEQSELPFPKE